MARRRSITTRSTGRPTVQSYDWARSVGSVTPDMTVSAFTELAFAVPSTPLGETIRRIRGEITIHEQTIIGNVVLGIYVRSLNTTVFEDPLGTGLSSDVWMAFITPSINTFNVATSSYTRTASLDVKAQRKLPEGRALSFILAWQAGAGSASNNVNFQFSVLGSLTRA